MPTYEQIWFPAGEAAGGDAKSGRGAYTKRFLHIDYIPLGDSEDPALTVSHNPLDSTGLAVPALKVEAGVFSVGDAFLIEKFTQTGAFLTGEFQGDDIFSVEGDGDIWNLGTMYAHKANVGGIVAAVDGTTALDMTQGNVFTCTPAENTSWSTSAPTNGIGGQLAAFVVDNSGGFTVAWAAGFTNVDSISASDTGIHTRLLQFDGTTWHQIVGYFTPPSFTFTIWNPYSVQTDDNEVCLVPTTSAALTISKITVTLDASANEVAGDLMYCDAFIGQANPVVINAFDTTSGVLVDASITFGTVPAGKCIYLSFDSTPASLIKQMCVDIEYSLD